MQGLRCGYSHGAGGCGPRVVAEVRSGASSASCVCVGLEQEGGRCQPQREEEPGLKTPFLATLWMLENSLDPWISC